MTSVEQPVNIESTDLKATVDKETIVNEPRTLPVGPIDGVEYPIKVAYCGICTLPVEYCQYYPNYDKCKEWLESNLPDEFNKLNLDQSEGKIKGKSAKRGGKGIVKTKKKTSAKKVELFRSNRGKKKFVTVCRNLSTFEIDLKDASKLFASKFACGSSVTDVDEIIVQGDVKDELIELILKTWPEIDDDMIDDLGDKKY